MDKTTIKLTPGQISYLERILNGIYVSQDEIVVSEHGENDVFVSSIEYGTRRMHRLSYDVNEWSSTATVNINQTDSDNRYDQKINLQTEELEPLIKALMTWNFQRLGMLANEQEDSGDNDRLDEYDDAPPLDDHPF